MSTNIQNEDFNMEHLLCRRNQLAEEIDELFDDIDRYDDPKVRSKLEVLVKEINLMDEQIISR